MEPSHPTEIDLERLRHRVAELEQEVQELAEVEQHRKDRLSLLTSVTHEAVVIMDGGRLIDCSPEWETIFGYTRAETLGRSATDFVAPESRDLVAHNVRTMYVGAYEFVALRKDGSKFIGQVRGKSLERDGRTVRVSALTNVTELRAAEEARNAAAVQQEVIHAQAAMLSELSTPLLPIGNGVIVLPLIGEVTSNRAAQVIEALTRGVFAHRAAVAILDITGTPVVDAEVADMLIQAAKAVQLLGARVMLTGVRPEVAQAIVGLGKDLGGLVTHGTLQQGVTEALREAAR